MEATMGEVAIIDGLLTNLAPPVNDPLSLFSSLMEEILELKSSLDVIHTLLKDAEIKSLWKNNKAAQYWLQLLKNGAYEVRDILDDCHFEDVRLQAIRIKASSSTRWKVTNTLTCSFNSNGKRLQFRRTIKEVKEKLDKILHDYKFYFTFRTPLENKFQTNELKDFIANRSETSSILPRRVYGRACDKEKIVDILVHSSDASKGFLVLPILGHGGLGKTTLAQMVFRDDKVDRHFDLKFWIYVSGEPSYINLLNLIVNAILGESNKTSIEIWKCKDVIQDKLRGKKCLFVLDDVWEIGYIREWDILRSILDCRSHNMSLLVTTRKREVANIMGTVQPFELFPLSDDDCWLLFEESAFRDELHKRLFFNMGKEIAKKCKGIPSFAKKLGSHLWLENSEHNWQRIRDSEIWEISRYEQMDVLAFLRLSYFELSYCLRRCFALCAIFPRGAVLEKERLIQLWMAHDLIPSKYDGDLIWNELCLRSFFQDEQSNDPEASPTCSMHHLMYELAKSIMNDECYTMDAKSSSHKNFKLETRHLTVAGNEFKTTSFDFIKEIKTFTRESLQTIIWDLTSDKEILSVNDENVFSKEILSALKKFPSLRVLDICYGKFSDLRYLGYLKHLRYLNLSYMRMTTLPNSICDLLNLQTLNIYSCCFVQNLPNNITDLVNMQHLYLDSSSLKYMPRGLRQLKKLKTLNTFVIGKSESDCQLDELKELAGIEGYLAIMKLGRMSDVHIARGKICFAASNSGIDKLMFSWEDDDEEENVDDKNRHEKIGKALEVPTTKLNFLEMRGYKGADLPKWVGESSRLTHLKLFNLKNVKYLHIVQLPLLQSLSISCCENLMSLLPKGNKGGVMNFNYLTKLFIWKCPELRISEEEFRCLNINSLRKLSIRDCPKLVSKEEETDDVISLLSSLEIRFGNKNFDVDNSKEEEVEVNEEK